MLVGNELTDDEEDNEVDQSHTKSECAEGLNRWLKSSNVFDDDEEEEMKEDDVRSKSTSKS